MNNKGFSILELIVSFSICMVIVVVLFQIVVVLKEVYEKSSIKTELLNKQNIVIEQIYADILEKELDSVSTCEGNCASFFFKDGTNKELKYTSNKLQYGEYATTLNNGHTVETIIVSTENDVASVHLPIKHRLFGDADFGIRIVHVLN